MCAAQDVLFETDTSVTNSLYIPESSCRERNKTAGLLFLREGLENFNCMKVCSVFESSVNIPPLSAVTCNKYNTLQAAAGVEQRARASCVNVVAQRAKQESIHEGAVAVDDGDGRTPPVPNIDTCTVYR